MKTQFKNSLKKLTRKEQSAIIAGQLSLDGGDGPGGGGTNNGNGSGTVDHCWEMPIDECCSSNICTDQCAQTCSASV
ncbi:hypothetical protein [Chryseobacterium populi]|uniref:Uncharacterized protein n=1 Tax=Chryseobacterium populi TaxID=1144316 RepID=J2K2P4_9FLAO|nr:hypothetical protein [Chryseobacterium populi]EJL74430.1 hypothetical protein PMI13_01170 [Chryseobacterium populi]